MEKDAWPLQKKYLKEVHNYIWNYNILWYLVISDCGQYVPRLEIFDLEVKGLIQYE
jgi:hypothetical protein